MKHPHCNRSHAAHVFWCRGFAPVVFILAIALIVVAIGSGIYFSSQNEVQAPGPDDVVAMQAVGELVGESTSSPVVAATTSQVVTVAPVAISIPASVTATKNSTAIPGASVKPVSVVDCGSNKSTTAQCLSTRIQSCSPVKGVVIDPASGLTVERIVDGYKGEKCSYRTNILSGEGSFTILAGMDINCLLPKGVLSAATQGGSMTPEDMMAYCTGSFVDLVRVRAGVIQ